MIPHNEVLAFCCSAALHRPCSVRFAWCLPKDRTTEMLNAAKRQPHRRRRQRHPPPFGPPVRSFHWSLIEFRFVSIRFDSLGCVRTPQSRFVRISICPASSPDGDSLWRYVLIFFSILLNRHVGHVCWPARSQLPSSATYRSCASLCALPCIRICICICGHLHLCL